MLYPVINFTSIDHFNFVTAILSSKNQEVFNVRQPLKHPNGSYNIGRTLTT